MPDRTRRGERDYSEDDLHCFDNLQWEISGLLTFLVDCNSRKLSWFKLSLGVFSIVTTGLTTLVTVATHNLTPTDAIVHYIDALIGSMLVAVGLVNLAIVKELVSIHSSRIITLRQLNCLRQAMDGIRFKKFEGRFAASAAELKNPATAYWQAFGRHRKLELDNVGLRDSERNFWQSPDQVMVFIVTLLSLVVISFPAIYGIYAYTLYDQQISYRLGVISGLLTAAFVSYTVYEIRTGRQRLRESLFGTHALEQRSNDGLRHGAHTPRGPS